MGSLQITELRADTVSGKQFRAMVAPDMKVFSPREMRVLGRVAFMFKEAKVSDIVAASHERGTPWELTIKEK